MAGTLKPVDALPLLEEAKSHLDVAVRYSTPADDQVMMDHIRVALALVDVVVKAQKA